MNKEARPGSLSPDTTAERQNRSVLQTRIVEYLALAFDLDRQYVEGCLNADEVFPTLEAFIRATTAGQELVRPLLFCLQQQEVDQTSTSEYKKRDAGKGESRVLGLVSSGNYQGRVLIVSSISSVAQSTETDTLKARKRMKNALYFTEFNASRPTTYLSDVSDVISQIYDRYFFPGLDETTLAPQRTNGRTRTGNLKRELDDISNMTEHIRTFVLKPSSSLLEAAKKDDPDEIVGAWNEQIAYMLDGDLEFPKSSKEEKGPRKEILKWRVQKGRCQTVLRSAEMEDNRNMIDSCMNDLVYKKFHTLLEKTRVSLNEAEDNLKFILSIETCWQPLYENHLGRGKDCFRRIMAAISWMSTVSRCYGRAEMMASLFEKVASQTVAFCDLIRPRETSGLPLDDEYLWNEGRIDDAIEYLDECARVQDCFVHEYKLKRESLKKQPSMPQFTLSEDRIFSPLLKHSYRAQRMRSLLTTHRRALNVQRGVLRLHCNSTIKEEKHAFCKFKQSSPHPMRPSLVNKQKFDAAYDEYMMAAFACEKTVADKIVDLATKSGSSSNALDFVSRLGLESYLLPQGAARCTHTCYEAIIVKFENELQYVTDLYNANNTNPPYMRGTPPAVGNILWSRQLLRRISEPMESFTLFNDNTQNSTLLSSTVGLRVIKTYNRVATTITMFETLWFDGWVEASRSTHKSLRDPLLRKHQQTNYSSNLDPAILRVITECRMLKLHGLDLPPFANSLSEQESRIKHTNLLIKHVLSRYSSVLQLSSGSLQTLFFEATLKVAEKLDHCRLNLSWSSLGVDDYLREVETSIDKLEACITRSKEILQLQIEHGIRSIHNIRLLEFAAVGREKLDSVDSFVQSAERQIKIATKLIRNRSVALEAALVRLFGVVSGNQANVESGFDILVQKCEQKLKLALEHVIFSALRVLKDRVSSGTGNSFVFLHSPLFKVHVLLKYPDISLVPGLEKIQLAISRVAKHCIFVSKHINRWSLTPEKLRNCHQNKLVGAAELSEPLTYFDHFGSSLTIVKLSLQIAGGLVGLQDQLNTHIASFNQYKTLWVSPIKSYIEGVLLDQPMKVFDTMLAEGTLSEVLLLSNTPQVKRFEYEFACIDSIGEKITSIHPVRVLESLAIEASSLKKDIWKELLRWKQSLVSAVLSWAEERLASLQSTLSDANVALREQVTCLQELQSVMSTLSKLRELESSIDNRFCPIEEAQEVLSQVSSGIAKMLELKITESRQFWKSIRDDAEEKALGLLEVQEIYKKQLFADVKEFKKTISSFFAEWVVRGPVSAGLHPQNALSRLRQYKSAFDRHEVKFRECDLGQKIFGYNLLSTSEFHTIKEQIGAITQLLETWTTVQNKLDTVACLSWEDFEISSLKHELDSFQVLYSELPAACKQFHTYSVLSNVLAEYRGKWHALVELKKPFIKLRHWKRVESMFGVKLTNEVTENKFCWSVKQVINLAIDVKLEFIVLLASSAEEEEALQMQVNRIETRWRKCELTFVRTEGSMNLFVDTVYARQILDGIEDSVVELNKLLSSKHVIHIREKICSWINTLGVASDTLNDCIKVQNVWQHLASVFENPEIARSLPKELKHFKTLEKTWIRAIRTVHSNASLLQVCFEDNQMKKTIAYVDSQFEISLQSLSHYLNHERESFPRFFFVADAELLNILSIKKDIKRIEKYIGAIFPGIIGIFDLEGDVSRQIAGLHSINGETLHFSDYHVVNNESHISLVLRNIEIMMEYALYEDIYNAFVTASTAIEFENSLKKRGGRIKQSKFDVHNIPYNSLINDHVVQSIVTVLQVLWTRECEKALGSKLENRRSLLFDLLREMGSAISIVTAAIQVVEKPRRRKCMEPILLTMIYQRDTLSELCKKPHAMKTSFDWRVRLRYYWSDGNSDLYGKNLNDALDTRGAAESATGILPPSVSPCELRILTGKQYYSFQYLGNLTSVVITPLTEKCYLTVTQAMNLFLVSAAYGSAGIGKTETIKSLAAAVGKYTVVFNCSTEMKPKSLQNVFRGLAQGGYWGLFDEFNRMKSTVLPVIALFLSSMMNGLRLRDSFFSFLDDSINVLHPRCAIHLTSNPSAYGGRGTLPASLKAVLRPISLVVPHRVLIMRVKLMVGGFKTAAFIAQRIETLLSQVEAVLPSTHHFDVSLRGVMPYLEMVCQTFRSKYAGDDASHKAEVSTDTEIIVALSVFYQIYCPCLDAKDLESVTSLLNDIYPSHSKYTSSNWKETHVETEARAEMEKEGYAPNKVWLNQLFIFWDVLKTRNGVGILGPSRSGKSSILQASRICSKLSPSLVSINPKSISSSRLFGSLCNKSMTWTDGIFTKVLRRMVHIYQHRGDHSWLVLDGCIDPRWAENLNSLLDENQLLTLANGDCVRMTGGIKIIFETDSMSHASPATVSRLGLFNTSHGVIHLLETSIVEQWLLEKAKNQQRFFNDSEDKESLIQKKRHAIYLLRLFSSYLPIVKVLAVKLQLRVPMVCLVENILAIFDGLLKQVDSSEVPPFSDFLIHYWDKVFTFSLVWAVGGLLSRLNRVTFHEDLAKVETALADAECFVYNTFWFDNETNKYIFFSGNTNDQFMRESVTTIRPKLLVPGSGVVGDTVFSYSLKTVSNVNLACWSKWSNCTTSDILTTASLSTIFIPTASTESAIEILSCFARCNRSSLVVGKRGAGKDAVLKRLCQKTTDCTLQKVALNYFSKGEEVQLLMESQLERKMMNTFGPSTSQLFVVLEDLNVPQADDYGTRSPTEILTQFIAMNGLYSLTRTGDFNSYEQTLCFATLPTFALDSHVSLRCRGAVGHVRVQTSTREDMVCIAERIFEVYACHIKFDISFCRNISLATVLLFESICDKSLFASLNPWWVNSMQSVVSIVTDIIRFAPVGDECNETQLQILWKDACGRIIFDKLKTPELQQIFMSEMKLLSKKYFPAESQISEHLCIMHINEKKLKSNNLDFSIFVKTPEWTAYKDSNAAREALQKVLNGSPFLSTGIKLFEEAVEHIVRVSRALKSLECNIVVTGQHKLGKKTITSIAAYISGFPLHFHGSSATETEACEAFKIMWNRAVLNDEKCVLVLSDTVLAETGTVFRDQSWKFANILMSSTHPVELIPWHDARSMLLDRSLLTVKAELGAAKNHLQEFIEERLRSNLKFVITATWKYLEENEILQRYPNINRKVFVTQLEEWPRSALLKVAESHLSEVALPNNAFMVHAQTLREQRSSALAITSPRRPRERRKSTVPVAVSPGKRISPAHVRIIDFLSQAHLAFVEYQSHISSLARPFSPQTFVDALQIFKTKYPPRKKALETETYEYTSGLIKLKQTEQLVTDMKKDLLKHKALLSEKQAILKDLLIKNGYERRIVNEKTSAVLEAKSILTGQRNTLESQMVTLKNEIVVAEPILNRALDALSNIAPEDVKTLRALKSPPSLIATILDAILIFQMRDLTPTKFAYSLNSSGETVLNPSWRSSIAMMHDSVEFLKSLRDFPRDCVNAETIEFIEPFLKRKDFNLESARRSSGNLTGLYIWVCAMVDYYHALKVIGPMRDGLKLERLRLHGLEDRLRVTELDLAEKQTALSQLSSECKRVQEEEAALKQHLRNTVERLNVARQIVDDLGSEKSRWKIKESELDYELNSLAGDMAISSLFFAYMGELNIAARTSMFASIKMLVGKTKLATSRQNETPFESVIRIFSSETRQEEWRMNGLPVDKQSEQNAVLCKVCVHGKTPLLIDPLGRGTSWMINELAEIWSASLRATDSIENMVINSTGTTFVEKLKFCIENGLPALVIDLTPALVDSVVIDVMEYSVVTRQEVQYIHVQTQLWKLSEGFRMYLSTRSQNLRYNDQLLERTTMINFQLSPTALEEQLLNIVVQRERANLETKRIMILKTLAGDRKRLAQLSKMLRLTLNECVGDVLDDVAVIEVLKDTAKAAFEVGAQIEATVETTAELNKAREEFRSVAQRGMRMYFTATCMTRLNPLYTIPFDQFLFHYEKGIKNAQAHKRTEKRIAHISFSIRSALFRFIQRSLFDEHSHIFAYMLALVEGIEMQAMTEEDVEFLLLKYHLCDQAVSSRVPVSLSWLDRKKWAKLKYLSRFLRGHIETVVSELQDSPNSHLWKQWCASKSPELEPLPLLSKDMGHSMWLRLVVIRCLRPDRCFEWSKVFIGFFLGDDFIYPSSVSLSECLQEPGRNAVVVVSRAGLGASLKLSKIAKRKRVQLHSMSLGDGQIVPLLQRLDTCMKEGNWLLVENCNIDHSALLQIDRTINDCLARPHYVHPKFCVWFCTPDTGVLPDSILANCFCVVHEQPQGVRAGMMELHENGGTIHEAYLDVKHPHWLTLLYALSLFHVSVTRRHIYGKAGFSKELQFGQAELLASIQFALVLFEDTKQTQSIDWEALRYVCVNLAYNSLVTDQNDLRVLESVGRIFFRENITFPKHHIFPDVPMPPFLGSETNNLKIQQHFLGHITEHICLEDQPYMFGLHSSAGIQREIEMGEDIFRAIPLQAGDLRAFSAGVSSASEASLVQQSGDRYSKENVPGDKIEKMLGSLPQSFYGLEIALPPAHSGLNKSDALFLYSPLNAWLKAEISLGLEILTRVQRDLEECLAISKGLIRPTRSNGKRAKCGLIDALKTQQVPRTWILLDPSSLYRDSATSLSIWLLRLVNHLQHLEECNQIESTGMRMNCIVLGMYFLPRRFLSGFMQEKVRMNTLLPKGSKWTLDEAVLHSRVTSSFKISTEVPRKRNVEHEHCIYIRDLTLEGGRCEAGVLLPPAPKTFRSPMPFIQLDVCSSQSQAVAGSVMVYHCPVYYSCERGDRAVLFHVPLPFESGRNKDDWAISGVAAFFVDDAKAAF